METQQKFMNWLNSLPINHPARSNVAVAREAFFAGESAQQSVQSDANPSVCPNCEGEDYHHSVECYLGKDLRR